MKRSAGITFAAVIALVGSIFVFLFGILMLVVTIIVPIPASGEIAAVPLYFLIARMAAFDSEALKGAD